MNELKRLREMIERLKLAAGHEGLGSLSDRLVSLEIETMALTVTAHRHERALDHIVQVKLPELKRQVSLLGLEILGYYGLPRETRGPGDNEPPVGPDSVRELRGQIAASFDDWLEEADSSGVKDRLGELLAKNQRG